jgi:hypothetical protein
MSGRIIILSQKGAPTTTPLPQKLTSLGVEFSITQLVDSTVGVHGMIPKGIFKKK